MPFVVLFSILACFLIIYIFVYTPYVMIKFFSNPRKIKRKFIKEFGKANITFIAIRTWRWRSQALFHAVINVYDSFLYITQFCSKWTINKEHIEEFKSIPQMSFFNLFKMYELNFKSDNIYKHESIYFLLTKEQADIIDEFTKSGDYSK